jgi:nicotinate-nucleotide pyrophosphorylase
MLSLKSPFKSRGIAPQVEAGLTEPIPGATTDAQTGAVIEKKSKEERWFVARLDGVLLLYGCISQVIKYLDQQNISAAYVSGMKEGEPFKDMNSSVELMGDLNLLGNEYNYFTT